MNLHFEVTNSETEGGTVWGFDAEPANSQVPLDTQARPLALERYRTYSAYASASVRDAFGPALDRAHLLRAKPLDSIALLNLRDHFEV